MEEAKKEEPRMTSILIYDEDDEILDRLCEKYQIKSRSSVIRFCLRLVDDVGVQLNLRQLRNKQLIQSKTSGKRK